MDEYLKLLLEQVRCKKAHSLIEEEVRCHMEEQATANVANGMSYEDAVNEAVHDMGSPIEAGISLDQIHRPKMAWDMVLLMAIISITAMIIHTLLVNKTNENSDFVWYTLLGFLAMLVVYRIDYSFLAHYSKLIAILFLGLVLSALVGSNGIQINGSISYLSFAGYPVSIFAFMMLYVPLYGAILYRYYGNGWNGILKSIIWMLIPIFFTLKLPCLSLSVLLFFSMSVLLTLAVLKGWFLISKKLFVLLYWGFSALLPVLLLLSAIGLHLLAEYQTARIRAFISGSGEASYVSTLLRSYFSNSQLFGHGSKEIIGFLPEYQSNYILTYITSSYGILAGCLVCVILALMVRKVFHISFGQKNQLGLMMGCGCGTVFLSNVTLNVLENTGFLPTTQTFLPFFSSGGSYLIVCYIMIGIIMSVSRYQTILPIHFAMKSRKISFK